MLHVVGDILQSLGVILAAVLIYWQPIDLGTTSNGLSFWVYVDPLITFVFSIMVIGTTIPTINQVIAILMQTVPVHVDSHELLVKMSEVEGVQEVHDMHVWGVGSSLVLCTAHVGIDFECVHADKCSTILPKLQDIANGFGIHHTTFQLEIVGKNECRVYCGEKFRSASARTLGSNEDLSLTSDEHV